MSKDVKDGLLVVGLGAVTMVLIRLCIDVIRAL